MKKKILKSIFAIIGTILLTNSMCSAQTIIWSKKANPTSNSINSVAFRGDGKKVISGTNCHPASIRVFDVASGNLDWDFTVGGNFMCIMGVTFSTNSNYIAAVEEMGNIFLFDNSGATPVAIDTINTGTSYAFATAISPSNNQLAAGCSNGKLKIYSIPNGTLVADINAHSNWVTTVAYTSDGSKIITGGSDDKVKIWSNTGTLLFTCSGHTGDITNVKVSPDNNYIISSSADDKIKIWEIATGTIVRTITGHSKDVNGVALSSDGKYIVSGSADSTCKIWEFNTGNLVKTFSDASGGGVNAVAWSPTENKILSGSINSDVVLWDVSSTLDVDHISASHFVNIYPNPAQNFLNIELPFTPENGILYLYDQIGQIQNTYSITKSTYEIDINNLANGIYYLVLQDRGNRMTSRFMVQR